MSVLTACPERVVCVQGGGLTSVNQTPPCSHCEAVPCRSSCGFAAVAGTEVELAVGARLCPLVSLEGRRNHSKHSRG